MRISTRRTLVVASVVSALLILLFGGGIATGTMMSGSMLRSGTIGPVSQMLTPFLAFVALSVAIFLAVFERERNKEDRETDL